MMNNLKEYIDSGKKVIICIEGLDGIGKDGVVDKLYEELSKQFQNIARINSPDYTSDVGLLCKKIQEGSCGSPQYLCPELLSELYIYERELSFQKLPIDTNLVICNRGHISNFLYQGCKLESNEEMYYRYKTEQFEKEFNNNKNIRSSFDKVITILLTLPNDIRNSNIQAREKKDMIDTDNLYQSRLLEAQTYYLNMIDGNKLSFVDGHKMSADDAYFFDVVHVEVVPHEKGANTIEDCTYMTVFEILNLL